MIWQALKSRDFVVAKSKILLPRFFIKEMLEHDIKVVKPHRGMIRLSQDKAVVHGNYNDKNNNNNLNKILFL